MKKKLMAALLCSILLLQTGAACIELKTNVGIAKISSDYSSDYQCGQYYGKYKKVVLTGNQRADVIAVAESQIGYFEGDSEYQIDGAVKGTKDFTEYGRFFGTNGRAWCSEFASWCIRHAGVPTSVIKSSKSANVNKFAAPYHTWAETSFAGGGYTPRAGDLALFAWEGVAPDALPLSHTSIVYGAKQEGDVVTLTIIHGNYSSTVSKVDVKLNAKDGKIIKGLKAGCVARFVAPNYDDTMPILTETGLARVQTTKGTKNTSVKMSVFCKEKLSKMWMLCKLYDGNKCIDVRCTPLVQGINGFEYVIDKPYTEIKGWVLDNDWNELCKPFTIAKK